MNFVIRPNLTRIRYLVLPLLLGFAGLPLAVFAQAEQTRKEIRAGVYKNYPPLYFPDEKTGNLIGFAIDTTNEVARLAGLSVRYIGFDESPQLNGALLEGRIDIIPNTSISKEREADMDFTGPLETADICIFVRNTTSDIENIESLEGKKVAVVAYSIGLSLIRSYGKAKMVTLSSLDEAILSLISGNTDALVYSRPTLLLELRKSKLEERVKAVGQPLLELKRGIAVRKGNPELLRRLSQAVAVFVGSPDYKKIYAKWYGAPEPYWNPERITIASGILLACTALLFAFWHYGSMIRLNRSLQKSLRKQKEMESALRESEERLRTLFDHSPISIWEEDFSVLKRRFDALRAEGITDWRGYFDRNPQFLEECIAQVKVLDVNQTSVDFFQAGRKENLKRNLAAYFTKESMPVIKEELIRLAEGGTSFEGEIAIRNLQGEELILWLVLKVDPNKIETLDRVFVGFYDITDRKRAEEAQRISQEQHRIILRTAMDGFWLANLQGRLIEVNDAYCRMSGYSEQELLSMSISDLEISGKEEGIVGHFRNIMDQGEHRFESRHRRKDGSALDVEVSIQYRPTGGGQAVVFLHDITERKQREIEKEQTRHLLAISQHMARLGSWETELSTGRLLWSDEMYRIMGFPVGSPVHLDTALAVFPPDERLLFKEAIDAALRREAPYRMDYAIRRLDGQVRIIHDEGEVFFDEQGTAVRMSGITQDITEQRKAEEEKTILETQLRQAQKMEAIGTLAGGIAHDFNNILAAILGYTEMALGEENRGIQEKYLQEALKGAERAGTLVKQILTFSRRDRQERKPLDFKALLLEALLFLRASIPATIEIRSQVTPQPCTILADPTQMHQIIMNLCTNAVQAMKQSNGILSVELTTETLAEQEIPDQPELKPGSYVRLTVRDTGCGIEPGHIHRVFEPFFTTKEKGEGTGLGLAVVFGIVKSHEGGVTVCSEPGKGAAFNVYLSRVLHEETGVAGTGARVVGGTERILLVDDEISLVNMGTQMLSSLGYQVSAVTSCREALTLFQAEPHRFDLLLTDLTLPKMTGIDLAREILSIRPDMPIILCSGILDPQAEEEVKVLGIRAYCMKPLTRNELSREIRKALS